MRYEFVGRKSNFVGKTLWEIVGNLKNFGVGRLVKKGYLQADPNFSFFKILKVQPLPPYKLEFENRRVIVWIEEIFKDRKLPVRQCIKPTESAKFQLIPKIEEEEYLKKAAELKPPIKYVNRYHFCPPLYRKLWEEENPKKEQLPKLETKRAKYEEFEVIVKDEVYQPSTCSLYKTDQTVEEMYLELVRLKKIIKSNKDSQQ